MIFLGGWALIAQNYKYLKIESLSFQIADEKKSDVPLILFLLSCSAAALQCVNISFIHEKIHYFSQIRDSIEPRLNFHSHITLLWISITSGRRIFSIIWLWDWAWARFFFFCCFACRFTSSCTLVRPLLFLCTFRINEFPVVRRAGWLERPRLCWMFVTLVKPVRGTNNEICLSKII